MSDVNCTYCGHEQDITDSACYLVEREIQRMMCIKVDYILELCRTGL